MAFNTFKIMKKLLLTIIITLSFSSLKAQGNLQFNAVKRISFTNVTVPYGNEYIVGTLIVPQGKVWKIESSSVIISNNGACRLDIDGQIVFVGYASNADHRATYSPPLWLATGTYNISVYQNIGITTYGNVKISAIEFNITE